MQHKNNQPKFNYDFLSAFNSSPRGFSFYIKKKLKIFLVNFKIALTIAYLILNATLLPFMVIFDVIVSLFE